MLGETSSRVWRQKLAWLAEHGGMALLNTHPDYMHFDAGAPGAEHYPVAYYREFLEWALESYAGKLWAAPPGSVYTYLSVNWAGGVPLRQSGAA